MVTEKKPRGTDDTLLSYKKEADNEDLFRPVNKSQLSKAVQKLGGNCNDTAYFYQEDGQTLKKKCISVSFSVFAPQIREKLVEGKIFTIHCLMSSSLYALKPFWLTIT